MRRVDAALRRARFLTYFTLLYFTLPALLRRGSQQRQQERSVKVNKWTRVRAYSLPPRVLAYHLQVQARTRVRVQQVLFVLVKLTSTRTNFSTSTCFTACFTRTFPCQEEAAKGAETGLDMLKRLGGGDVTLWGEGGGRRERGLHALKRLGGGLLRSVFKVVCVDVC